MTSRKASLALGLTLGASLLLSPSGRPALSVENPSFAAGDLDPAFGDGDGIVSTSLGQFADRVNDVALQVDGKVVVAGYTSNTADTTQDFMVARFAPDGELDSTFGQGGIVVTPVRTDIDWAYGVAIQSDGKIVAAGASWEWTSSFDFTVVRYNTDGSLDPGFGEGGIVITPITARGDEGRDVAIQQDGKIVVAGYMLNESLNEDFAVVRYMPDGTLDTDFGTGGIATTAIGTGYDVALALALQTDGKIVAAGASVRRLKDVFGAARYAPDGSLDGSFGSGGILTTSFGADSQDDANSVSIQSDGKILLAGTSGNDIGMVRYKPNGARDPSFSGDGMVITSLGSGIDTANDMALAADGKIVVVGTSHVDASDDFAIVRYETNGSLDADFGGDGFVTTPLGYANDIANGVAIQPDGKIVAAGDDEEGSSFDFAVGRYLAEGVIGSSLPTDFNGDGYADLAVGVPWEDVGAAIDTGAVTALYGAATGLLPAGNQFWDEEGTGVSSDEQSDGFGFSTATGDFNGDGFADLAAGVPAKAVNGQAYAGAVNVLYGSPAGLVGPGSQQWTQNSPDVEDAAETDDFFGWSVAAGDLNGDGFADLAVGVPGEAFGDRSFSGAVNVLYGSTTGLAATGNQFWSQDSPDIANKTESGDQFGVSVAVADFDGNGFGDLAAGVPLEDLTNGVDAGAVNVIYGSAAGLTSVADDFWNQDSDGINNKVEDGDLFGVVIGTGDFDGNGFHDLIVGVPLEDLSGGTDAGAVNVIYGTASGLDDAGDDFWNQDSTGIANEAETQDQFGISVTAGDFDADGHDDAAIGVIGEDVSGKTDSGGVAVIYGTSGGLDDPGNDFWHQDSPGIEDSAEKDDLFGYSVIAADFGNGPEDDLAIGVPLEGIGGVQYAGAVNVIYGSPSDLTSTGDQFWNQDSTDIIDRAEYDDEFGFGLAEPGTGGLAPTSGLYVRFARPR